MPKFNWFSSGESSKPKQEIVTEAILEKIESKDSKEEVKEPVAINHVEQAIIEKDNNFNVALSNLSEAVKIQKELGGKISPESVFEMTGMQPEELLSYLEGKEINIGKEELSEIMKPIEEALENLDKHYEDTGKLRKFANSKVVRAAFVASMLFLKFAPQAQAAESHDLSKDKDAAKKEWKADNKIEPDNKNTYISDASDFEHGENAEKFNPEKPHVVIEEGRDASKIELTNYFVTDSDKIPESSVQLISDQFESFLDKITPENVDSFLSSDFIIYGSSDERPTSSWGGSNENLTAARIAAIDHVLSSTLDSYEFKNLDHDKIEQLKAKTFKHVMPEGGPGEEAGVTYITDLINPDTGVNYTDIEVENIKNIDALKYHKLLDSCRNINFHASVESHDDVEKIQPVTPSIEKEPIKPVLGKLHEYKNIVLLFDNSPSMGNSYKYIGDAMQEQIKDNTHNIIFSTFSDKLGNIEKFNDSNSVSSAIEAMDHKGASNENSLESVIDALEKIDKTAPNEKSILLLMTDENLQDVSMEHINEIKNLAQEKNVEVKFMYGDDKTDSVKQISLDDISKGYDDAIKNIYKSHVDTKLKIFSNQVERLTSLYENKKANFERGSNVISEDDVKELKNNLDNKVKELESLKSDWNSGDVKKLFENSTLKSVKFGGNSVNEKFTVSVMGDVMGEPIR